MTTDMQHNEFLLMVYAFILPQESGFVPEFFISFLTFTVSPPRKKEGGTFLKM